MENMEQLQLERSKNESMMKSINGKLKNLEDVITEKNKEVGEMLLISSKCNSNS